MEQTKLYLVATLIEYSDNVSDGHSLYRNIEDATNAMKQEIADCRENFNADSLEVLADYPRYVEERTQDGYGFQVSIEEVVPQFPQFRRFR